MMSYQKNIYDQYADYVPRAGADSKKIRDYAEKQYKQLVDQGIWEDKSMCFSFLQQVNQEIIGIPPAEERRKKQQQAQQQRPQTVTVSDPSTNYQIFQQPQTSQLPPAHSNTTAGSGVYPPLSKPVPYAVTSDMRVASSNSLDKIKSLRVNLQHQLTAPASTAAGFASNNSSIDFNRHDEKDELPLSYRRRGGNPQEGVDEWRRFAEQAKHVSWQPSASPPSSSLEDLIAHMKGVESDTATRSQNPRGTDRSKGSAVLKPQRASSPSIPLPSAPPSSSSAASASNNFKLRESVESTESAVESQISVDDVESSEEDASEEEDAGKDLDESSFSQPPEVSPAVPSKQEIESPNHHQPSFSFISNTTASIPSPTTFAAKAPPTASPAASPVKLDDKDDSLRVSQESLMSANHSTNISVPINKQSSKPKKYVEDETSDEEEINLSGSYQSFRKQSNKGSHHKSTAPASPKLMPDIHIHNHNHFPPTNVTLPPNNYQPHLAMPTESNRPRLAYSNHFDENIPNQVLTQPYPTTDSLQYASIQNNYGSQYPSRDNRKVVVMNGLDTLRDSIDLSGLSLQRIRDITGHY